jgi:hypothetical protein
MIAIDFPEVIAVRYAGGYRIWLRFSDGVEGDADLTDWLEGGGPVFVPLRDTAVFSRVRIELGTVAWPNAGGTDVAPEALYEKVQPTGASAAKQPYARLFDDARRLEAADVAGMPEISRFFGIVIRMFWREHEAPHFHAQYGEYVAQVEITSGAVRTRRFPGKALQLVDEWRERNSDALLENWERIRR